MLKTLFLKVREQGQEKFFRDHQLECTNNVNLMNSLWKFEIKVAISLFVCLFC